MGVPAARSPGRRWLAGAVLRRAAGVPRRAGDPRAATAPPPGPPCHRLYQTGPLPVARRPSPVARRPSRAIVPSDSRAAATRPPCNASRLGAIGALLMEVVVSAERVLAAIRLTPPARVLGIRA